MASSTTKKTVYVALAANLSIAVVKAIAGAATGSSAMLAEAAHSVADSFNQVFLWLSLEFSERPPDPEHPFGHGKDRFFWSFLAAVVIFLSGAVFSIARGVLELAGSSGSEVGHWRLAYGVLAFSFLAEGASLVRAVQQVRAEARAKREPLRRYLRESRDVTTKTVVFEDSAAVVGVVLAFVGIALYHVTGEVAADASASIAIGLLLGYVALRIGMNARDLLLGIGARPEDRERLLRTIESFPEVERVVQLRTMYLHPESLLVAAKIDFVDGLDAERIEQVSNEIDQALRRAVPEVSEVYLDPTPSRVRAAQTAS
jgi:cation diffusion facilitator family transporter